MPFSSSEDGKDINKFLNILANNDLRIKQSYDRKKIGGYILPNKIESEDDVSDTKLNYEKLLFLHQSKKA